ncbi:MAG: Lrp/AsnC ligand binding domain-containing protein [Nitrosotalea sp.]
MSGLNIDPKLRDDIIESLLGISEVIQVSEVTGRFDILISTRARSLKEFHSLMLEKIGTINGVKRSESFVEMKRTTKQTPYRQL